MDSKMECMRAQIDRDPQAEGYFSAYSSTLGRVALRKMRYLDSGAPTNESPDFHKPDCGSDNNSYNTESASPIPVTNDHPVSSSSFHNAVPASASNSSTSY